MSSLIISSPDISVVVIVYNMRREAPRTLLSLSAQYQRHIAGEDYEIIVVDNGSTPPFDETVLESLPGNFRLLRMDTPSPSPARAINRGLSEARGKVVGVMIDGARIVTPGLLHFARHGAGLYPGAVVASLGWYLGSDLQRFAIEAGYNQLQEDALLASIEWPKDGYRLFEIATMDESSAGRWFRPLPESNALFLRRGLWDLLGGVDERFDDPGGGFVNLDTYRRAMELPESKQVILLGEATFHQVHGGVATNAKLEQHWENIERWTAGYEAITGRVWSPPLPNHPPTYLGTLPKHALLRLVGAVPYPVGSSAPGNFNRELWSLKPAKDSSVAQLVQIAHTEFRAGRFHAAAAVLRIAREHAPAEPEPQRLLSHIGPAHYRRNPTKKLGQYHAAVGQAYLTLGDTKRAASEFQAAIASKPNEPAGWVGLAKAQMPGPLYTVWLRRLHRHLVPQIYIEIGILTGATLALARPPTRAIGIDPAPKPNVQFRTETHIFTETSDDFFTKRRLEGLLAGQPIGLGFIDGLHLFEQALRDFVHLERYCSPRSVLLLHDTLPIAETVQDRSHQSGFHTGDIWRTVLCLKHFRPDLDVFTVATPWSGLTVVCGLDPHSRVLEDNFEKAVERFMTVAFSDVENDLGKRLGVVPNQWKAVVSRLRAHGIMP